MKILLFGGSGQVGQEFRARARDLRFDVVSPVTSELDITDREQVRYLAKQIQADAILNCAAYTAVDAAEENRDVAFEVNAAGTRYVAEAALETNSRLIHISTDYVFDGSATAPIPEDAEPNPLNVYGASKLAGEEAAREVLGDNALIIRTSSVHGRAGQNIVHTILSLLEERDRLTFVSDQIMAPTWAGWLGEVLVDLVRLDCRGTLHACCSGAISWYEFASEVLKIAKRSKPEWHSKVIDPVSAVEFPRPARRPAYSVLSTERLARVLGRAPISWQTGLQNHMKELGYE